MKVSLPRIVAGRVGCPPADLVYSAGLFDYLHASAAPTLRAFYRWLRPGGSLVVANLTPRNTEAAFMEAVMDWWMQYRDENALLALVEKAGIDPSLATTETTDDGRVAWLRVRKA